MSDTKTKRIKLTIKPPNQTNMAPNTQLQANQILETPAAQLATGCIPLDGSPVHKVQTKLEAHVAQVSQLLAHRRQQIAALQQEEAALEKRLSIAQHMLQEAIIRSSTSIHSSTTTVINPMAIPPLPSPPDQQQQHPSNNTATRTNSHSSGENQTSKRPLPDSNTVTPMIIPALSPVEPQHMTYNNDTTMMINHHHNGMIINQNNIALPPLPPSHKVAAGNLTPFAVMTPTITDPKRVLDSGVFDNLDPALEAIQFPEDQSMDTALSRGFDRDLERATMEVYMMNHAQSS